MIKTRIIFQSSLLCAGLAASALLSAGCTASTRRQPPPLNWQAPMAIPGADVRIDVPELPGVTRVDLVASAERVDLRRLFPSDQLITLSVEGATLPGVLQIFSHAGEREILADPEIEVEVNAFYDNIPLHSALENLLDRYRLAARIEGSGLRIGLPDLVTVAFHLSLPGGSGEGGGGGEGGGSDGGQGPWKAIEGAVGMMLSERGEVLVDPQGMMLIVRDLPSRIGGIERILEETIAPHRRQVIIEAMLMEVALNDSLDYGIDWAAALSSGSETANPVDGSLSINLTPGVDAFSFLIQKRSISALLEALRERGQINVLSAPRLTTLNRVTAKIAVTEQIPYYTSDLGAVGQDTVQSINLEFKEAGVTLEVTPTIAANGEIVLELHPEVTEVTGYTPALASLPSNPILDTREINTTVRTANGESVVLRGLIRRRYSESRREVPGLGSIPVAGSVFRNLTQKVVRSELVMIITASHTDRQINRDVLDDTLSRTQALRHRFLPGPAPAALREESATAPASR